MGVGRFVTSYLRGSDLLWRRVTRGEGVKNRPKKHDVIYGRPLEPHFDLKQTLT